MSDRFRLVSWEECRPVKVQLNRINQKMYSYMNSNCKELLFDAELVGSGKRGLVTARIGGNQGFDFDYNLVIDPPEGFTYNPDAVKQIFMDALNYAIQGTGYSYASDSTRAMTIKVIDTENSRIVHSCDYAIVYYLDDGYYYLHNDKTNGSSYSFNYRQLKYPVEDMEQFIIDNSKDGHAWIREKYLQLKNADKQDKQSYVLYIEALYAIINEICQYHQSSVEDADDQDDD